MTLSLGVKNNNEALIFTDCMVTEISPSGERIGTSEALKLAKIFEGIYFSMVGDADQCKSVRDICRELVSKSISIEDAFNEVETFFKISKFDGPQFELLIMSRHNEVGSRLFYYRSDLSSGMIEINHGQYALLGSAKDAVEEKVKNFIVSSANENYIFATQFPMLLAAYLNQWCIGDNIHEGYKTFFGSRILYIYQNGKFEILQPTSITLAVFHSGERIVVRIFTHFWDEYGLILYDSYKHGLNYLVDDNNVNLENIPKGEDLYNRMRDIYFNHPHTRYQFMFIPDIGSYHISTCDEFKFINGEEGLPQKMQQELNNICTHFKKSGEVIFGNF